MTPRSLDALVAEKVMGYVWRRNAVKRSDLDSNDYPVGARFLIPLDEANADCNWWKADRKNAPQAGGTFNWVQPFSTDIAAAWQVVEKMTQIGSGYFTLRWVPSMQCWQAIVDVTVPKDRTDGPYCPSATRALCLAALKAVGGLP